MGGDCREGWRGEKGEAQQGDGWDTQLEDTESVTLDGRAGMFGDTLEAYERPTALGIETLLLYQRSGLGCLVWG